MNQPLKEEADNQTIEGVYVEQEDVAHDTYVTMVCFGKMVHIIFLIMTELVIVTIQ